LDLNNSVSRNTKIVCHSEEQVCIISLIVRKYENSTTTMFTKINKLEIIYIKLKRGCAHKKVASDTSGNTEVIKVTFRHLYNFKPFKLLIL
jgi:hypothetical protein